MYSPPLGTVPGSGSQTLTATFTPTDTMNYTTVTASVTLNVGYAPAILTQPASQVVAVGQTATFTVGRSRRGDVDLSMARERDAD